MNLETNRNSFDLWSRTLDEWRSAHGANFSVEPSHLRWNLERQSLVRYETAEIAGTSVIHGIATEEGAAAGLATNTLWVSLWGQISTGREAEFVNALKTSARAKGKSRLLMGADEFHFTSGVPMSSPAGERLIRALDSAGFKGMEVADYVGELASRATSEYITEAEAAMRERRIEFVPSVDEEQLATLESFLMREFPGRWVRELQVWRRRDDTGRAFWMSLFENGEIVGFARMCLRGRVRPLDQAWTPGALRLPLLGPLRDEDSCLGPIGVAASQRGRGTGKILLALVLRTLREKGATRVCIDWTNAFKYYEALRYERVRRIWTSWMD